MAGKLSIMTFFGLALIPILTAELTQHVPVSHILKRLQYRPVRVSQIRNPQFWVATPDWEQNPSYPGAAWYKQAWDRGTFNVDEMDDLLALTRENCYRGDWFINLGCHLGIFSLAAAALGCKVVCVEGFAPHTAYIEFSRELNGYRQNEFKVINAVVDRVKGHSLFGMGFVADGHRATSVPATTFDSVVHQILKEHSDAQFAMALIDVETHDQHALLGAAEVLAARVIPMIKIETWCVKTPVINDTNHRTAWPGVDLLIRNRYRIFSAHDYTEVTSLVDYCASRPDFDILAVKEELSDLVVGLKSVGRRRR